MTERLATTPFGGAGVRARNFALRVELERRQKDLRAGKASNDTGKAEKWELIRALSEARETYGLSDRAITVLEALTSFHQDRQLDGTAPIIVFPSNTELSIRSRGMSPATLRRHLAALVEAGLILRRDSANGKRFCQRNSQGEIQTAFGFDLAPLALRAGEILSRAETAREEARTVARLRSEITLHLRDISKIIIAAQMEERAGDWQTLSERLTELSGRVSRNGKPAELTCRCNALLRLRAEVENTYSLSLETAEMSASDSVFERHIQNSESETHFESMSDRQKPEATGADPSIRKRALPVIDLQQVLKTCPQITDYAKNGIESWRDLTATADLVRSILGITPALWVSARRGMGDIPAAIVIAAILERSEHIRSPGAYLRELIRKTEKGKFSIHPMLNALKTPPKLLEAGEGRQPAPQPQSSFRSGPRIPAWQRLTGPGTPS